MFSVIARLTRQLRKQIRPGCQPLRLRTLLAEPLETRIALATVQYKLETTDLLGNPIASVVPGGDFLLRAFVQDLRPLGATRGVFAAYTDVTYDATKASVNGGISYGASYPNGQSGDTST